MGTSSDGDRPWQSYNTVYTNAKAGMDGVDKEKIQRIVYEMSKGSKYFENEQRKEAFCKQKIENLRAQVASLTDKDISHFQKIADRMVLELEASRDLSKVWLHTDMDAFYAAVETLENPSLRGKPMAVGSLSMISTANYEARKFGVRAAMPGFIACKLCPDLIFVPTNFERYTFYSGLTRKVFRRYDPEFIATSLDEAYLNITDVCISRGVSSDDIASELRDAIFMETGLTCSVGVAPNHMLAKVCSDINKPNGQFILPNDKKTIMAFISSLPIRKIGGIGKVTEHVLRDSLEINTCEDMIHKGAFVCALFSSCSSDFFLSVGLGLGRTNTPEHRMRKSISSERTFRATKDESFLFKKLGDISETLSIEMLKEGLSGRTLTLKLKTDSFEIRTRAVSLHKFIHTKDDIFSCASNILKAELPLSLRLIGLRLSQFHDEKNVNVDPMQKTIVGFLTSDCANPSATLLKKQDCSDNDMLENHGLDLVLGQSIQDVELDFLAADDYTCERQDDRLSFLSDSHSSVSSSVAERFELNDFCLVKPKPNNSLRPNGAQSFEVSTQLKEVSLVWIDDYICSICGTELPSSFKEERLEHSDYHIAEILQEEESSHGRSHRALQERRTPKELHDRECMRKKKKIKKCCQKKLLKHVPIEDFFSKLKKNS